LKTPSIGFFEEKKPKIDTTLKKDQNVTNTSKYFNLITWPYALLIFLLLFEIIPFVVLYI